NFPDRKKNLVKYNNDLNDNKQYYGVSSLSKYEMDIFFFLIAQLQGQDGAVVDIKIKDLKRYLHMPTTMSYRTFQ
ncbi:RepB family plasmid replication initiator protein, partial [Lactobacillus amylovorus]